MSVINEAGKTLNLAEIKEIEISVLRRIQELTTGDHKSVFRGAGFDLVGLREWQPGDKLSSVDWPQSAINNYDPMLVREFEEDKGGTILIVADASLSMQCGTNGLSSGDIASKIIATIGFSGVFFQDLNGLFIFDGQYGYDYTRPRLGRNHVVNCISKYFNPEFSHSAGSFNGLAGMIMGSLKRTSIIPVISDFLFPDTEDFIEALSVIKTRHDVFGVMVDCSFLFNLPEVPDGWVSCADVESGRPVLLSKLEFTRMVKRVTDYQDEAIQMAHEKGIEVVKLSRDRPQFFNDLTEFFFIRKTKRKISM